MSTIYKSLPYQIRADLFNSLAALEQSGLPALQAFTLLKLSSRAHGRVEKTRQWLGRGLDIASAGAKSGLFSPFEASLLRAALQAGSPATTYRRLADSYSLKAQQRAAIKSRLMLPLLVLVMALLVQPLPSLVAGTISGGGFLLQSLRPLLLLSAMFYLAVWFKNWFEQATPSPAQDWISQQLTRVPVFGLMHVRQNNRDFFASLALLLEAGLPMFDALPHAVASIGNSAIRKDFARLRQQMTQGATLAQAIERLNYVGNSQVLGYIHTGESSGTLPEMLQRFVNAETVAVTQFQTQVAEWLPRMIYALLMLWMAYVILTGAGFMPRLPPELQ